MSTPDEKLDQASKLLRLLSWKNLGKIAIVSIIAMALIALWMFKSVIFSSIVAPRAQATQVPVLFVSEKIKTEITTVVKKSDAIVAMQIVTINFPRNIRLETFVAIDNPTVQSIYTRYNNNKVAETPFFDHDKNNNSRILRLIGGEFVCMPYKESVAYRYAPEANLIISDVCAIGIPPIYGEFTGILTIYLSSKPTKEFQEQMHMMARDFALRIYEDNKLRNEITKKH